MTIQQARGIQKRLRRILDSCEIYPRRGNHLDAVSFSLFLRMCELHETVCILAGKGLYRDAVVLSRMLCEAVISYNWLTNKDTNRRFSRYVYFKGKIQKQNIEVVEKHFKQKTELTSEQKALGRETEKLFKDFGKQWNDVKISNMAHEADTYETIAADSLGNMVVTYELFYWWFSLHAHPSIEAIQNFLPPAGKPFTTKRKPASHRTLQETIVVFQSTFWLFLIANRIDSVMALGQDAPLRKVIKLFKKS